MFEDQKFLKKGWAVKVPLGNDELYVMKNERPLLYETEAAAEEAAKIWKKYRIVYFEGYV